MIGSAAYQGQRALRLDALNHNLTSAIPNLQRIARDALPPLAALLCDIDGRLLSRHHLLHFSDRV